MKRFATLAAAIALFGASPAWASTTINFDSYTPGYQPNPLTDSGATFGGTGGLFVYEFLPTGGQQLCSTDLESCALQPDVSFASAVSGLSFLAAADDSASTLSVMLTLADMSTQLVTFTLDGDVYSFDPIDLSEYGNLLGISVTSDDDLGLVYDDFTFTTVVAPVPEPSTWLMLLLGFGIMGSALRRLRHAGAAIA